MRNYKDGNILKKKKKFIRLTIDMGRIAHNAANKETDLCYKVLLFYKNGVVLGGVERDSVSVSVVCLN